jgi:thioredoxin-related protein
MRRLLMILLILFSISSCNNTKERKLSYNELLQEHEEAESLDNFGMLLFGVVGCYLAYRNVFKKK